MSKKHRSGVGIKQGLRHHDSAGKPKAYPPLPVAGIVIMLLSCLHSALELNSRTTRALSEEQDSVIRFDKRFDGAKKHLPRHGVIGYLTERFSEEVRKDPEALAEYYLTQYAMAPLVVDNCQDHPFVIGNFHSSAGLAGASRDELIPIQDLGNGIVVFGRKDAK